MAWMFKDNKTVCHEDGHKIKLQCGDWSNPRLIQPEISFKVEAMERVRLIHAALEFARENSTSKIYSLV